jgi:ankyrin repeat protein
MDGQTAYLISSSNNCTNINILELLIKNKANINHSDNGGDTALIDASRNNNYEIVKFLINHNANVSHYNNKGQSALIMVADNGNIDIAKLLIKAKANINHADIENNNALIIAVFENHIDIVKLLIENNANVNYKNSNNLSAISIASSFGYIDVVNLLLYKGKALIDERILNMYIQCNKTNIITLWYCYPKNHTLEFTKAVNSSNMIRKNVMYEAEQLAKIVLLECKLKKIECKKYPKIVEYFIDQ